LKVVGRAGIGVDNVDIPAAPAKGVVVRNTPFGNSITTAEHAIALMFALARQLPEPDASTQAGKWEKNRFLGAELTSKTLGLIDEAALKELLDSGHIAGAALDVFVTEPATDSPLFGTPNFVSTPHLGASTSEAQVNVAIQVAEQMADYLMSGGVTNALNVPSL